MPLFHLDTTKSLHLKYTVADIHQAIIGGSVKECCEKLKIDNEEILHVHLGKFILDSEVLTLNFLKKTTVRKAFEIWEDDYYRLMPSPIINMSFYTGQHLHTVVSSSNTTLEASRKLGVQEHLFTGFLQRFTHDKIPLTFEILKCLSDVEAFMVFGDHYAPANAPQQQINLISKAISSKENDDLNPEPLNGSRAEKVTLNIMHLTYTIAKIHQAILATLCIARARSSKSWLTP
jgi:hypothetical protein